MAKRDKPFRGGALCHWCRRTMLGKDHPSGLAATKDHIHPKSRGGAKTVWSCLACNNLKGSMPLADWYNFMGRNPEWWKLYRTRTRRPMSPSSLRNGVPKNAL